jgi:hypothetical protein
MKLMGGCELNVFYFYVVGLKLLVILLRVVLLFLIHSRVFIFDMELDSRLLNFLFQLYRGDLAMTFCSENSRMDKLLSEIYSFLVHGMSSTI